jgi:hypothetical protein
VDAGGGWLIFGLPPAEVAVHPAEVPGAELYFATTSQPAMQFPQKWQAGRVGVDTDSVAFLT